MTDKIKYEVGKEYKLGTRVVKLLVTDRPRLFSDTPMVAMDINDGCFYDLAADGSGYGSEQLTEIQPWDTLKPGDLCIVGDSSPRVFAGAVNGRPTYWDYFERGEPRRCSTCRPLTEEELAKIKKGI